MNRIIITTPNGETRFLNVVSFKYVPESNSPRGFFYITFLEYQEIKKTQFEVFENNFTLEVM